MRDIRQNSVYAWLLAARPKTLTAALIPVMLGSGLAFSDGKFQTIDALLCLGFACLMQIAANFINDLLDYQKGTDREDRLGPKRACAEGWITLRAMRLGIGVTLLMACLCGLGVLYRSWGELPQGGWELVAVGVTCILFAFLYTTYLSYHGWGDVLVLVFFGFVPVAGTYYVQTGTLGADVWILSLVSGLVINTLLTINNYRDVEQDRQANPHRTSGGQLRKAILPGLGHCRRAVMRLVRMERTAYLAGVHLGTVHLPLSPPDDMAPHLHHTQR